MALGLLAALVLTLPAAAQARPNQVTLGLNSGAANKLDLKAIRLVSTGIARGRGAKVRLPVTGGKVGRKAARLRLGGGFEIRARARAGKRVRQLKVGRLELRLGKNSAVVARLPRKKRSFRLFLLRHGPRALRLDRGDRAARLSRAKLVLAPAAQRRLARGLGLGKRPRRALGRLAVNANLRNLDTTPPAAPPVVGPPPPEPTRLARPASAVDVTAATITWCVRASWIRYVSTPTGPHEGISFAPPVQSPDAPGVSWDRACDQSTTRNTSELLNYRYTYAKAPGQGWYDPVSKRAALYFVGKVNFRWDRHGIDIDFTDPEVELNGAASRLIFRFEGRGGTAIPGSRAVLTEFKQPGAAALTEAPIAGGTRYRSGEMPGFLPTEAGGALFASFYGPGDEFGWTQVSFDVPAGAP